jgi:transposase
LSLLEKYGTVEGIKKAGVSRLIKIKGITQDKATSLISKMTGLNIQTSDHMGIIIKRTAAQILHLEESIKKEKEDLYRRFKHSDEAVLLTTTTGIGEQSAVEILVEIEDVNRFESAKKLVAYFGTHPMWKQSGDGLWGNHMSKKGRSEIRAALYMCGLTAIRKDQLFKDLYATARAKGKNHYSAMGVVMNKMLRIIYGILKNKTKYNSHTDYSNRQNAATKQKDKEEKQIQNNKQKQTKLERFNLVEVKDMPVTKRYAKKKRQSPKLQKEECTGSNAS